MQENQFNITKGGALKRVSEDASGIITIPQTIKEITDFALFNCKSVTEVKIPSSVTGIGVGAFYKCISLEKVTIGKNVRYIDLYAFRGCENLKQIIIFDNDDLVIDELPNDTVEVLYLDSSMLQFKDEEELEFYTR